MIIFNQVIKRIFKNKIKLIIILFMPVIFILMFAMQQQSTLTVGVVDKDNSTISKGLINNLRQLKKVQVLMLKEDKVYDKAVSYGTDYSIIIQEGFEDKLMAGEASLIKEFYLNPKEKLFYARLYVDNYLSNMKMLAKGTGYDKIKFSTAFKVFQESKLSFENAADSGKSKDQSRIALAFLVQFMLYMSVITAGLILEDKNSGVFYRVFYAPVSIKKYLFQNLAAFLIIAIIQVVMILLIIKEVLGLGLGEHPFNMFILFVVFSLVCVSLGLFVVSLFKKSIYAYTLILFITTPIVMLGGCYWKKEMMPDIMQKIALFLPTTWLMDGVDKLLFENKSIANAFVEIMVLFIFAGIFLAAGLVKKVDVSK
ncbi:MAG: ABC transporter permease [Clostridiaceae bacterium]|nr:ABC transporter permease [Clostridiaceae bacterium]